MDKFWGTPWHKHVPARVEPVQGESQDESQGEETLEGRRPAQKTR